MQIKGVGLHTINLIIRAQFGLSLIEVGLSSRLTVQLLDLVALHVEQVAVICFLVGCREPPEYQDVLVRQLEETATLQTDPVCVLLYLQIQCLPSLASP